MGVHILEQPKAQLRIGLLNLMPAPSRLPTIEQYFGLIGANQVSISPVLVRFDEYVPRSGREDMLAFYEPFSVIQNKGLDGLIVTGANLELTQDKQAILPASEILYHKELIRVFDWARANVRSTVYSCLMSHVALEHFYGITRAPLGATTFNNASGTVGQPVKTFGVFSHIVDHSANISLTRGMNDQLHAPQSRWGDVLLADVTSTAGLQVMAASDQSGWQMLATPDAKEVYLQGHPEYFPGDLATEYVRDKEAGMEPHLPVDYFPDDDDMKAPVCNWRADAHVFFRNWLELLAK